MAGRKPRSGKSSGRAADPKAKPPGQSRRRAKRPATASVADKDTAIARLTAELADVQARLREVEEQGTDAFMARKIEGLLAAAQTARGQALDASLARSKAEGELRALERVIAEARGPAGWLLRRVVARRVRP